MRKMTMIKPTVGRVVWYWPDGVQPEVSQPHAALVTRVWGDTCVNLAVFDANGSPYSKTSVELHQDENVPRPTYAHASWMPYQVGQAKRNESAV